MSSVLCVGVAVYDQIFAISAMPPSPTKVFASAFAAAVGGPAANGAVTIARQGGRATLWARVGADAQGGRIVDELGNSGVDVSEVRRVAGGRSGTSAVAITASGERLILAFADPDLERDAGWLPVQRLNQYDAVLSDVRWPDGASRVLLAARAAGVPSVLDADLTSDDTLSWLTPLASHVVFSLAALRTQYGSCIDLAAVRVALEDAWRRGAHQLVAVTLGAHGCAWYDGHSHRVAPGVAVDAVDTLAAGDAFHGAFALAVARRLPIAEGLDFANRVAALKCSHWGGGAGIPTAAQIASFDPTYRPVPDAHTPLAH